LKFLASRHYHFLPVECNVKITKAPRASKLNLKKIRIMTTIFQTSAINSQFGYRRNRRASNIYSVVINAEDGNYQEFEIEASSETEAHAKADSIAQSSMIDVTYIEVYKVA
jgi:hypothetical protein